METKLFIIMLRRPTTESDEMRSDPFWEFGSFGLTGCHERNLLNPNKIERLNNSKLAFVQGGSDGFKLLLVTSKVNFKIFNGIAEVTWDPKRLPFKYSIAPIVIRNDKETNFPYLTKCFLNYNRSTLEGKFASAFRARTTPLDEDISEKLINDFERHYKKSKSRDIISNYTEALPYLPPKIDLRRLTTYKRLKGLDIKKC